MTKLTENISQIVHLTTEEQLLIENAFISKEILKGELWVKQGKICNQVAFVVSGKFRSYYIDDTGNEKTCFFTSPGNFISSLTSFLTNTPANENIYALEDSELRVIYKKDLEDLSDKVPKMHVFRRVIAENLFIAMEKRIVMLQSQSAQERYEKMIKENSEILLTVPLHYTASFLGITPQHLSRLRKELLK